MEDLSSKLNSIRPLTLISTILNIMGTVKTVNVLYIQTLHSFMGWVRA